MNKVFIATSIDGYIADKNGSIDWLHSVPNPQGDDMGYAAFMRNIDAIIMGRKTYETVLSFGIDWPYEQPVFVLSNTLQRVPEKLENQVVILSGKLKDVLEKIHEKGHENLYIDGGTTLNHFLREDLIDEMILTTIPVLLGGGTPLFRELLEPLSFELKSTKTFLNQVVQRHYVRMH